MSDYITPVLLITGLATAGIIAAVFAPAAVLAQLCAEPPTDRVGLAITRHWALLVFCVGALLIYAAYQPHVRVPVLVVAATEKIVLAAGVFSLRLPLRPPAYIGAVIDATFAGLYLLYLAGL
jgi:protein-S-isoprenylcysteine O-methyltransferase Ste14